MNFTTLLNTSLSDNGEASTWDCPFFICPNLLREFECVRSNSLKISEIDKKREVWLTRNMQNQTRIFLRIHQQQASAEDLLDIIGHRNETWKSCRREKNHMHQWYEIVRRKIRVHIMGNETSTKEERMKSYHSCSTEYNINIWYTSSSICNSFMQELRGTNVKP